MNCTGVILAAGASRRMGRPKALLPIGGETFVDRLTRVFQSCCGEVIIVLGHHAAAIRPRIGSAANVAINPDPSRGQLSSLQCALALLPSSADAFLFTPVDCPSILESTVVSLLEALAAHPKTLLAIPRFQGRRGHPAACRASLAPEFLSLPPTAQAREVVHRHADQTIYLDTTDPGVLADIDDPQAYNRLVSRASLP
ncbi:MAG: Molybdenum cofactor cytidylyltransferase [Bryobacteraceae bacterium]|nr:Molybdenum cofactor cytidylyltransferase [Bryobacteraceae bacterium]